MESTHRFSVKVQGETYDVSSTALDEAMDHYGGLSLQRLRERVCDRGAAWGPVAHTLDASVCLVILAALDAGR